ncbi:OmpP1/FadL family transporter [Chthonobacter albigriseus]|uniref:OmpP1/FadL family transporter n=1 Tax=Chthonobacter albigriseus TaxID=1683161 RepID=UPI0015EEE670|nr:outer membrane protein transport protein [Chthonobacter albigriseus]
MAGRAYLSGVAVSTLLMSITAAQAGGFALREQSATSQGASFAGAAAPGDSISAMFWNPSAITTATGLVVESHGTIISPSSELKDATGTLNGFGITGNGGDVGIDGFVPSSYIAYQVNDQLYLGLSINAPFGLATKSDPAWVGQFDHYRAKVFSVNVQPTVAYKINDMLSVGVGAQIQYFDVNIQTALDATSAPDVQRLVGDDVAFGFTAGLTFTPLDGTVIGLGYRSQLAHALEGNQTFEGGLFAGRYDIGADVDLPQSVTLGLRQKVTEDFTLLGGIEWTDWSSLGTIPIEGSPVPGAALTFEYEDGWFFSLGGEYAWNENLTLRAGLGYELSPIEDEYRSMRLPDSDRLWASIGASYKVNDRLSFDAAYTHLFVKDASIDVDTPTTGPTISYSGTAEGDVDIFAVSLRYKLGG